MSEKKASPSKRKPNPMEGVYFKKIKLAPRLKLAEAKLARDRRDGDGFVEGEATLRILDVPDVMTRDRCPKYFPADKSAKPCWAKVVCCL